MHSSHMRRERTTVHSGYGSAWSPPRVGRSAPAQGDAGRSWASSAASAARIASRSTGSGSGLISSTRRRVMPRAGPADDELVGRRVLMLAAALTAAAVAAGLAFGATGSLPNWAAPQISTVVAHGLMGAKSTSTFHPNSALTKQTLTSLAFDLEQELGPPATLSPYSSTTPTDTTTTSTTTTTPTTTTTSTAPTVSNPGAPESMAQLDQQLVSVLGLGQAAKEFAQGARAAGAAIPVRFGIAVFSRRL